MIVGFSKHGKGGGYGPVAYLTSKRNPDIPPDERLGLRPTIPGDAAPDVPTGAFV